MVRVSTEKALSVRALCRTAGDFVIRTAAILTTRVMDAVSRLPGIATLDWCDRAAAAMTRIHHPCHALVALCTLNGKGHVDRVDVVGAAHSCAHDRCTGEQATVKAPASPCGFDPAALCDSLQRTGALGWSVGALHEEGWCVSTASRQGLSLAADGSPLARRWAAVAPADVILGAVHLPGGERGRTLIVEIASADPAFKTSEREQAVVAAALPMLALRAQTALGDESVERHQWLTPREELVLWRLVAGKKVPQIADELHRSVYTVHDHVKSLHRKLGASNRGQLVARALGHLGPANTPTDDADRGAPEVSTKAGVRAPRARVAKAR